MNNLKTFNVYALMLVGTFIDTLVWGSYGSVQDHIKVYGNCIKVYKITQTEIFIPVILFLVKKVVKKGYCRNEGLSLAWDWMKVC